MNIKNYSGRGMLRKLLTCLLPAMLVALALAGCGASDTSGTSEPAEKIAVGALNGPTGMGLIDLADDEMVDLQTFQAPDEVVQKLLSGDIDVACLPSNMGAVLNAKTDGGVKVLTTVVTGVLYLVENGDDVAGLADLKGRTVYASGRGGTPEYVLQALLESAGLTPGEDVEIEWMDAHADVAQKLLTNEGAIALLPEPFVSTVTSKSEAVKVAVDLNAEWTGLTGQELPMGILIAKKDFVESRADDVAALLSLVAASVEDVNGASDEVVQKIVDAGFLADPAIAKSAIPRCSMTCMSSDDSKSALSAFYEKLYEVEPASVGGALPADDLYY